METSDYKQKLEAELAELNRELATLGIHNPQVKEDWITTPDQPVEGEPDPNDAADVSEEWIERRGILSQLETRYNNILDALKKIEDGTFGYCEICNNPIEPERLAVNPSAQTCETHMNETAQRNDNS